MIKFKSERPHHGHCRALERDIKPRRPMMPQQAMLRLPKSVDEISKTSPQVPYYPKTHRLLDSPCHAPVNLCQPSSHEDPTTARHPLGHFHLRRNFGNSGGGGRRRRAADRRQGSRRPMLHHCYPPTPTMPMPRHECGRGWVGSKGAKGGWGALAGNSPPLKELI